VRLFYTRYKPRPRLREKVRRPTWVLWLTLAALIAGVVWHGGFLPDPGPVPRAPGPIAVSPPNTPRPIVVSPRPAAPADSPQPVSSVQGFDPRPVRDVFEAQLALDRLGISSGSLDGVPGPQTHGALRAFQQREGLAVTGELDAATKARLRLEAPPFAEYTVTAADLERLQPLPDTWLGKSIQDRLDHESILELISEKGHAHPLFVRRLNPGFDWSRVTSAARVRIPNVGVRPVRGRAAGVRIRLGEKTLQAYDADGRLLAHYPCSIARHIGKRPLGELRVAVTVPNPNYMFDPENFPESEEARGLGRRLVLPPGPNNPVGVAWIGLDRPGYGIHGTPAPEQVGRTESHGCFRLANWNAAHLLELAWVGMPVWVNED
jgi:lipoprotein-anchoring transpeptidase ErfK/SrfK